MVFDMFDAKKQLYLYYIVTISQYVYVHLWLHLLLQAFSTAFKW